MRSVFLELSFHHTNRLNSNASSTHNFNTLELFFHQLNNLRHFLVPVCNKFQQKTIIFRMSMTFALNVSAIWKHSTLSSGVQFLNFNVHNFFHADKYVCEINNLNNLDHTVQLFFDLLKRLIVTDRCYCHSRHSRIFCCSYSKAVQII